jgi:D-alanyl-D-alanine carboxypeptidase (penicillin-binding protein 5/6)
MVSKKNLPDFFDFLKSSKQRQFNFFLTLFLFCLLPVKNSYLELTIIPGQPVLRSLEFELPAIAPYPVNISGQKAPELTALSVLAIDLPSKAIIFAKNPDRQLSPASTTKIMTALISLEHYSLDEILKVGEVQAIGRTMGLKENEELTAESLLYGLLVHSGNDVADVLAANYPGGKEAFVKAMNEKAQALHLEKTYFTNPAGIDNGEHLTTTHDLAILAAEAMENPFFRKAVATADIVITDITGKRKYSLTNVNQLLGKVPGLKGIKTGWTTGAGECLVSLVEREDKEIITVVLGSQDRFGETKKLVDWVFANHQWEAVPAIHQ